MEIESAMVDYNCIVCSNKLIKETINNDKIKTHKCETCKTLIVEPGCYYDLASKWVMLMRCGNHYFYNYEDYIIGDSFEECSEKFKRLWKLRAMR